MRELALFAGAGGGILGGRLLGWRTVCAVEVAPFPRRVLLARQRDGHLDPFPVWDDIRTFDGNPWRGHVDIVTGGFPCQDISIANPAARGISGARSNLWSEMVRVISEIRPNVVLVENSPVLTSRGLGRVLGDLAEMGFDAEWGVLGADATGAPHIRKRIWVLAYVPDAHGINDAMRGFAKDDAQDVATWGDESRRGQRDSWAGCAPITREVAAIPDPEGVGCDSGGLPIRTPPEVSFPRISSEDDPDTDGVREPQPEGRVRDERGWHGWWGAEPRVGRMVDGVADRVDRVAALGNGQVPAVVALAWRSLTQRMEDNR